MKEKPKQIEQSAGTEETALTVAPQGGELVSFAMNMADLEGDAEQGSADISIDDIALPFYKILNASAKEVLENESKFIEGAVAGMILNIVDKGLTKGKEGIRVLRAAYQKEFVEWAPVRGGGPKGRHEPESATVKTAKLRTVPDGQGGTKQVLELPNGNILVETAYHYVVVLCKDGSLDWATIPMSGGQLKYSDRWNSMIQKHQIPNGKGVMFHPAHYQQVYEMRTFADKNTKGNYYSWLITKGGDVEDIRLYNSAKEYRAAVLSGALKSQIGDIPDAPAKRERSDADDSEEF